MPQEDKKMDNTIALNYWVMGGFDASLAPKMAIDKVKDWGLDGIELTFGDLLKEDITKEELEDLSSYAKEKGVKLASLATGFYWGCSLSAEDKETRDRAIEFTKKYIKAAASIGAELILVVPGAVEIPFEENAPIVPYEIAWKNSISSLKEVVNLAEEKGIHLGLENVWNNFLLSPIEMKLFLEEIGSDYIGVYFDVGNVTRIGVPEHWISSLGKKWIKAIHIKNFTRQDACGGLKGFGEDILVGEVDMQSIKSSLQEIAYQGPITAEMIPFSRLPDLNIPDLALAEKTAKSMLASL